MSRLPQKNTNPRLLVTHSLPHECCIHEASTAVCLLQRCRRQEDARTHTTHTHARTHTHAHTRTHTHTHTYTHICSRPHSSSLYRVTTVKQEPGLISTQALLFSPVSHTNSRGCSHHQIHSWKPIIQLKSDLPTHSQHKCLQNLQNKKLKKHVSDPPVSHTNSRGHSHHQIHSWKPEHNAVG